MQEEKIATIRHKNFHYNLFLQIFSPLQNAFLEINFSPTLPWIVSLYNTWPLTPWVMYILDKSTLNQFSCNSWCPSIWLFEALPWTNCLFSFWFSNGHSWASRSPFKFVLFKQSFQMTLKHLHFLTRCFGSVVMFFGSKKGQLLLQSPGSISR